jgi:toxin ParE1/3/4
VKGRILLRPAAYRDLEGYADYLARTETLQVGLRFLRAAENTFQLLARHPEMGTRTAFRNSFLNGMRMFPLKRFPNHLAFYRGVENGIETIRVIHGARDIEALFERGVEDGDDSFGPDQNGEIT